MSTLSSALDIALDDALSWVTRTELTSADLMTAFGDLERFRNRLALLDHALIGRAQLVGLAERHCFSSLERLMVRALRISPGEARRRVRAAEALSPRSATEATTGLTLPAQPPRFPVLAAAQAEGEVNPEQVGLVERALADVDLAHPKVLIDADVALTDYARVFAPPELRRICHHLVETIDPDGSRPRDSVQRDLRYLRLHHRRDGMIGLEGRLTPATGAQLQAVLGPLAAPAVTTQPGPAGGTRTVADPRPHEQRMHDALDDACARLLRSGDLPASGGTPATVIITMTADQLATGLGAAITSTGDTLTIPEALRLTAEAELIPTVLTAPGRPLHLGRTRRLATTSQTYALIARDGGCSFPGCRTRPEWCDRHHVLAWADGGTTSTDNLTLLCRYHHTHYAQTGWDCELDPDGLPVWRPPPWQDPERRPLLHHRIRQRHQPSG